MVVHDDANPTIRTAGQAPRKRRVAKVLAQSHRTTLHSAGAIGWPERRGHVTRTGEAVAVTLSRRETARRGGLFDWVEDEFFPMPLLRPFAGRHLIRVEDYVEEGQYVLRAELPGIDPDKDVDVTVADGILTVQVERAERRRDVNRSEFRYGTFRRSVTLPGGADEDDVNASYHRGILEIRVGMKSGREMPAKHIPISKS
jgi:HSP20 family protein